MFRGTRLPIYALFDNLDAGVTREQVDEVLSFASKFENEDASQVEIVVLQLEN